MLRLLFPSAFACSVLFLPARVGSSFEVFISWFSCQRFNPGFNPQASCCSALLQIPSVVGPLTRHWSVFGPPPPLPPPPPLHLLNSVALLTSPPFLGGGAPR